MCHYLVKYYFGGKFSGLIPRESFEPGARLIPGAGRCDVSKASDRRHTWQGIAFRSGSLQSVSASVPAVLHQWAPSKFGKRYGCS